MLKIAICDDDSRTADLLERIIHSMQVHGIETEVFLSGEECVRHLMSEKGFQIVLMDIELPNMNGIETAQRLRKADQNVILIYITAHREYVYQIFETLPFRFLEKPVSSEKLEAAVLDAMQYLEERKQYFSFCKGHTAYQILIREILYFEAENRKIKVHTTELEETFYGRFRLLAEQLNPNYFLRIHTSFIINMDFVCTFHDRDVLLKGGITLPVRRKYKEQARLEHLNFLERRCDRW